MSLPRERARPDRDALALLSQRPELSAVLEEIQLERFARNAETLGKGDRGPRDGGPPAPVG